MSRTRLQELGVDVPVMPSVAPGILPLPPALADARKGAPQAGRRMKAGSPALDDATRAAIAFWIAKQEEAGLDVLSDGWLGRNGEGTSWFASCLGGFVPGGLVRTWGDRFAVKPVLAHEARWRAPVTVDAWMHAQGLTGKPVKARLPGPWLMLDGCFVERYPSRVAAGRALARELRREAEALVNAGCRVIEVVESMPAGAEEAGAAAEAMRILTGGLGAYVIVRPCDAGGEAEPESVLRLPADNVCVPADSTLLRAASREGRDLTVGVGGVRGGKAEPAEGIMRRLRRAASLAEAERIWVGPEGGLGEGTVDEAIEALASAAAAAREARRGPGG